MEVEYREEEDGKDEADGEEEKYDEDDVNLPKRREICGS